MNKVLQHLTQEQLTDPLVRQSKVLFKGGIAIHSFWYGDGEDGYDGLLFRYYSIAQLTRIISPIFEMLDIDLYK